MTDPQLIQWYNRRYTPDEVRKRQVALNKLSLGKQIAVDGKIGVETINAVKQFLAQHSNDLKVDGMIGDQTSSALGITGLGDASLPATRKGVNQARKASAPGMKGVSAQENERMRQYYNSPEMLRYLLNASSAATDPQYFNHYQNALNYVSPEVAARLRNINGDGDEYDAQASINHNNARSRKIGILEVKNAIASGYLKPKDYAKWQEQHHLSNEEMQELLNDPEVQNAMHTAGVISDNGRQMTLKALAERFQKDVTNAMNEFGRDYVLPAVGALGGGAAGIPYAIASFAGGTATDAATDAISGGKYGNWAEMVSAKTGMDPVLASMTNPGSWIAPLAVKGLTILTRPTWNAFKNGTTKYIGGQKVANPRAGETYSLLLPGKRTYLTEHPSLGFGYPTEVIETPGKVVTKHYPSTIKVGLTINPKYVELQALYQNTPKFTTGDGFGLGVPVHGTPGVVDTPIIQEVPTYDPGVTYGPYRTTNNYSFKNGGKIPYMQQGKSVAYLPKTAGLQSSLVYRLNNGRVQQASITNQNNWSDVTDPTKISDDIWAGLGYNTIINGNRYYKNSDGTYSKQGSDELYGLGQYEGKNILVPRGSLKDATWDANTNTWGKVGYTTSLYRGDDGKMHYSYMKNPETPVIIDTPEFTANAVASASASQSQPTPVRSNTNISIVDYLRMTGQDSSYANRKKLAGELGIQNYSGTAVLNMQLIKLLRDKAAADARAERLTAPGMAVSAGQTKTVAPETTTSQVQAEPHTPQERAAYNRDADLLRKSTDEGFALKEDIRDANIRQSIKDMHLKTDIADAFVYLNGLNTPIQARHNGGIISYADYLKK